MQAINRSTEKNLHLFLGFLQRSFYVTFYRVFSWDFIQHILLSVSSMVLCDFLVLLTEFFVGIFQHILMTVSSLFLCDFLAHFIGSPPPSPWISVYLLQKLPAEPLEYKQYSLCSSCSIII